MQTTLDSILGRATEDGRLPGVVAVVVDRDGVAYEGAFGVRSLETGVVMSTDTVVRVASQTKSVVAVACLQAVEDGLLDLDAPASETIPSLGDMEVLEGFDEAGTPILRPATTAVTLRNLLTHTSGSVYEFWNADCARWLAATGHPDFMSGRVATLDRPLAFDPGTDVAYGLGIDWAGRMLEEVTDRRLGEILADRVLGPLGMTDTGYAATPSMDERMASVHFHTGDEFLPVPSMDPDWEFESGGANLLSTVGDFCRFMSMVLGDGELDGERILRPETLAMACRNNIGDLQFIRETSTNPMVSNDFEYLPGVPKTWGLGWVVNEEAAPSGRSPGSVFGAGLFNSWFWIDRTVGVGGMLATQVLPYFHPDAWDLYGRFETSVYDHLAG